jgi:hypothetical protein
MPVVTVQQPIDGDGMDGLAHPFLKGVLDRVGGDQLVRFRFLFLSVGKVVTC